MVESSESQPNEKLSPGKILLQGRLQAGLTQEQVAKELYMTVYKVKALEADDYSRLSSDTFARGYIRAYANLVKIDVVVVLAAYDQLMDDIKPPEVVAAQIAAPTEPQGHRGAWQFLVVIGAFLIGIWLISVWFFDNHTETEYVVPAVGNSSVASENLKSTVAESFASASEFSSSSSSVSPMSTSSQSRIQNALAVKNSSSSKSANAANSSVFSSALSSIATSSSASVAAQVSVKKTSLDEISFSFRAESWLEVSDSRGDVLATELEPAGSKLKLVGLAPFDVKLGNAPAVDVQLNGKKIDVIPLLGSNVLILKVGN
ncbi:MAG: DUF4115 domain-containing protein [Gammaproteobacteria bacterium]|nr:MAG: DUF4115 domain-containing protein [Gammaproteobacteria bacterium]